MNVEYMCHSGSDLLVVDAARASFGKRSSWDNSWKDGDTSEYATPKLRERDAKLINFLARERHLLPFRHPTITLQCKAPIFVARQLGKHQVGMSWSEESRRYVKSEPEFYWPDKWRMAADNVKQGSSDEVADPEYLFSGDYGNSEGYSLKEYEQHARNLYNWLLMTKTAPEQARMLLPQNMYTTWVWTGTLLAWIHMLKERTAPTTQKETRDFAHVVAAIIQPLFPVSYPALMENKNTDDTTNPLSNLHTSK